VRVGPAGRPTRVRTAMSPRPLSHVVLQAALVFLVAALAGCGGASSGNGVAAKGPSEILASAKVLADTASSVHVSGSIVSGGSPLTFNLHLLASKGVAERSRRTGSPLNWSRYTATRTSKGAARSTVTSLARRQRSCYRGDGLRLGRPQGTSRRWPR